MLTRPEILNEEIIACLSKHHALPAARIEFLPLGADQNSAVYRVVAAADETPYFLKLRRGSFNGLSLALPRFLGDQGIEQVIAPLATSSGQLQAAVGEYSMALYPFVAGRDGYETRLSEVQWRAIGAAFGRIHGLVLPPALGEQIRRGGFSPRWREAVRTSLERAAAGSFPDPLAEEAAAFLRDKHDETLHLVERAERLAEVFQARTPAFVLCHADFHAGNVLITDDGACYIVDWDEAILAPKERDLMSVGGGLMGRWYSPQEEEALFYPAYGGAEIDPFGLAYYRYERIIEDIALISERIFSAAGSMEERRLFFGYLTSNYLPGHTIEMAYRADPER